MQRFVVCSLLLLISFFAGCQPEKPVKTNTPAPVSRTIDSIAPAIPTAKPSLVPSPDDKYFLIADIFTQEESARERCAFLLKKGLCSVSVLHHRNGYFCVSIHSYKTKQEAQKALGVYRSQKGFAKVWIMTRQSAKQTE